MNIKKSNRADLEKKKLIFKEIGIICSLLILFGLFEYSIKPRYNPVDFVVDQNQGYEEQMPLTVIDDEIKPPVPEPITDEVVVDPIIKATTEKVQNQPTMQFSTEGLPNLNGLLGMGEEFIEPVETPPFVTCEVPAEFPGGKEGLRMFVMKHIRIPQEMIDIETGGKVVVKWVVDEEGNSIRAEILTSSNMLLNEEVLRVISTLPKFKPAKQMGKKVKMYYVLPVEVKIK